MASPPRTLTNNNFNINNNNNVTNLNTNNDVATPKRKTTAATPRPSSLLENNMRKKSQDSSCASVKSSKSPMRSRTSTGTFQKKRLREVEGETAVTTPSSEPLNYLSVPESDHSNSDDSISPRRDSKMARFQEESTVQANIVSTSPKFLRSQRSVTENPNSQPNSSQNPSSTSQNLSQNLAGEFHTGCTQQFNSMNFGLNPCSSHNSSPEIDLNTLFQQNDTIPELGLENFPDLNNDVNASINTSISSSVNLDFSTPQSPQRYASRTQFSTPISRTDETPSHHAISTIQSIFTTNESHDSPHIGDSGFDLETQDSFHSTSINLNQLEPQISTFRLKEYKDLGHLGAGGSSIVYRAAPPTNHFEISAIKRFENPQESDSPQHRKKRESNKTQAKTETDILELVHSNGNSEFIITLYRYEEENDYTYVQLELMDDSLENLMKYPDQNMLKLKALNIYNEDKINESARTGNIGLCLEMIRHYTDQVVRGLMHCHSNGIVHRDIKSGNLLIHYQENQVKIADFGLSVERYASSFYSNTGEKRLVDVVGTPANFAPEMWLTSHFSGTKSDFPTTDTATHLPTHAQTAEKLSRFGKNLDDYIGYTEKVDIWALGCVLVQLASGIPLYNGKGQEEMIFNETMEFDVHGCNYSYNKAIGMLPGYLKDDDLYDSFVGFLKCCFEHSPADRADAHELYDHEFLWEDEEMEPA
jgi:serine/threonine protein kinase